MDPTLPDHSQPSSWWNGTKNFLNFFTRVAEGEGVAAISEAVAPAGDGAPASRERLVAGTEELSQRTDRFLEAAEKLFTALRGPQDKGEALPCAEVKMDEVTRDGAIQSLHLSLDAIRQANLDSTYTTGGSGFATIVKGTVCDDRLISSGVDKDPRKPTIFMPYDGHDESWGTTGTDIHLHLAGRQDTGVKVLHSFDVTRDFIAVEGNSLLTESDTVSFEAFSGEAGSYVITRETDRFGAPWTRIAYDADGDRKADASWLVSGHQFSALNIIEGNGGRGDVPSPTQLPLPFLKSTCHLPCKNEEVGLEQDEEKKKVTPVGIDGDGRRDGGGTGGGDVDGVGNGVGGGDGSGNGDGTADGGSGTGDDRETDDAGGAGGAGGTDGAGGVDDAGETGDAGGEGEEKVVTINRPSYDRVTEHLIDIHDDIVKADKGAGGCGTTQTSVHAHVDTLAVIGKRAGDVETPLQLVEAKPAAELNFYVPLVANDKVIATGQRDVIVVLPEERQPGGSIEITGFQSGADTLGAFYFSGNRGQHSVKEGSSFDGTPQQWILYQDGEGPWVAKFDDNGDAAADFTAIFRDGTPVTADILLRAETDSAVTIGGYTPRPFTLQQKLEHDSDMLRSQAKDQTLFTGNEAEGYASLNTAGILGARNEYTVSLMGDIKHNDLGLHRDADPKCAPVVIFGGGNIDLVTGSPHSDIVSHFVDQRGGTVVFWRFDAAKDGVAIFGAKGGGSLATPANSRTPTELNQAIFYEMTGEEANVFVTEDSPHQLNNAHTYFAVEFHGGDGDGQAEFRAILETKQFTADNLHLIA